VTSLSATWRKVRAVLLRRGVPLQDVDDIVQEAFARLEAYTQKQELLSEEAFLVTTAMNVGRDQARHHMRMRDVSAEFDLTAIKDAAPEPEEKAAIQERLRRVNAGLARLEPVTRRCLLAHRLDDMSYPEIARREGLSVAAVEKRVARAVMFLAQWTERK